MIRLKLKIRKRSDNLTLSMQRLKEWVSQPEGVAKQLMYDFFEPLKDSKPTVHDYIFIQQIIAWTPVDKQTGRSLGLPQKEQVRLFRLTERLLPFDDADEPEEGYIELSTKDIEILWKRMNDEAYLTGAISIPYGKFLLDFQEATGRWFEVFEDEQREASKPELEETEGPDNERESERAKIPATN